MPSIGNIALPQTEKVGVIYTSDGPINDCWINWNWIYIIIIVILLVIVICMLCYLIYCLSCPTSVAEKKINSPPDKLITRMQDDCGSRVYEYKLDKSIYSPKNDPNAKVVTEYSKPTSIPQAPKIVETPILEPPKIVETPILQAPKIVEMPILQAPKIVKTPIVKAPEVKPMDTISSMPSPPRTIPPRISQLTVTDTNVREPLTQGYVSPLDSMTTDYLTNNNK